MLNYKKTALFFSLIIFSGLFAQTENQDSENQNSAKTYIKANAVFLPIGMINVGIETKLADKYTFQGDIFVSPWKSFAGHNAQFYILGTEGRYYFDEAFKHWYVGANISFALFNIQKWTYWNDNTYIVDGIEMSNANYYQKGFSYILGATIGYQFKLGENWNMDIYLGGGTMQSFYRGYDKITGKRIDSHKENELGLGERKWNRSGEFLPYRGGIMISYKLQ
ncbi:MAG: DUF3575 domain-containing protein [Flavobacteriaceae bacterium]|jgi:hypothetical protein|nr:DUF3575 domain-containing protein [Flavobacteriaceae bacterium]